MVRFSATEIFGIAEQIERNGTRYYETAAEQARGELEQLLLRLAEMEKDHEDRFQKLRAKLGEDVELAYEGKGANREAEMYLRCMSEGRVFDLRGDPVEDLTDGLTEEEVLRKAIDLEKDSIIFYLGMKELVPSNAGKKKVQEIIDEEIRHIGMLSAELPSTSF